MDLTKGLHPSSFSLAPGRLHALQLPAIQPTLAWPFFPGRRFDLAGAAGPHRLDHGDLLYAPNCCGDARVRASSAGAEVPRQQCPDRAPRQGAHADLPRQSRSSGLSFSGVPCRHPARAAPAFGAGRLHANAVLLFSHQHRAPRVPSSPQGRLLLWAWLQERRAPGTAATYAGCLTLPRVLTLSADGRRLVQTPAPELVALRRGFPLAAGSGDNGGADGGGSAASASASLHTAGWYAEDAEVAEGQALRVEGVAGQQLDLELTFRR